MAFPTRVSIAGKRIYGGMLPSEARELKQLREENVKLKRLVADLSLDKMLQDVVQKKVVKPVKKREVVRYLMCRYGVGTRRACRCVPLRRSVYYYGSCKDPLTALRQRVREFAHARVRFGYRRIYVLLKREGWEIGKDRLYRVYREEGLGLRGMRPWRHASAVHREVRTPAVKRNDVWSMDFMHDELADGRRSRTLTVIDVFTRECLDIEVGQSLKSEDVVRVMERLKYERGVPRRIYCDNGSEIVSARWINGRTQTASGSSSADWANQPTMRS